MTTLAQFDVDFEVAQALRDADFEEETFEDELQALAERLGELIGKRDALRGKAASPGDFKLHCDIASYKKTYRKVWKLALAQEAGEF